MSRNGYPNFFRFSLLLLLTPINYKFNTYKIVISIHGHLNTDARKLCTEHCHFSFGIYLQTKRRANEMQGRLSTFAPKKSTYSRLSLYAAYYDGFKVYLRPTASKLCDCMRFEQTGLLRVTATGLSFVCSWWGSVGLGTGV